jgi:hypothetical protein
MERRPVARQVDLAGERGEAVAEAAIDPVLRGPQVRDGLAPRLTGVELGAHHRGEHASPAMGRQHADDAHPGGPDPAARHRELQREGTRAADHPPIVPGAVHPLGRHEAREARHLVVPRPSGRSSERLR